MKNVSLVKRFLGILMGMVFVSSLAVSAPEYVKFRNISYNGTGCPLGTVSKNISLDRQAFTLAFSDYVAETGPGISRRDGYRNCIVSIDLYFPGGWQWAVTKFDYRGYASLDKSILGTQKTRYWFQGHPHGEAESVIVGPYDDDYHFTDYVETHTWSPCGATRALNINSDIRLNNRRNRWGSGLMTLDSLDGSVSWEFGIAWRPCR